MDVIIWRRKVMLQSTFLLIRFSGRCIVFVLEGCVFSYMIVEPVINVNVGTADISDPKRFLLIHIPERISAR